MAEPTQKKLRLPPRWVIHLAWRIHRGLYRSTGGRLGLRKPSPGRYGLLRLTTIGRRTGQERGVMLAYVEDGDNLVTMAMNGWGADEPAWWLNLQAHPDVQADLGDGLRLVTGRAAAADGERERLWAVWRDLDDKLDGYAAMRPSETAVVILEPRASELTSDYADAFTEWDDDPDSEGWDTVTAARLGRGVRSLAVGRVGRLVGEVHFDTMDQLDNALRLHLAL